MPEDKKERLRSASNSTLPLPSVLPDTKDMNRVRKLLGEAATLREQAEKAEKRLTAIKEELAAYAESVGVKGFRHGLNAFEYNGYVSRASLSKEQLLANGVTAEQIRASMVNGNEYLSARFIDFDLE